MKTLVPQTVSVALIVALTTGSLCAAEPLAYRFKSGDSFTLVATTSAEPPMTGPIKATLTTKSTVGAASPDGADLQQSVTRTVPNKPDFTVQFGCRVSPSGQVSSISGLDMSDPRLALVAKNAAMGLPTLPDDAVSTGSTWADEKPMYLPKVPLPGVPDVVRIQTTYTVTGMGTANGKPTVEIATETHEAPGQKVTVAAKGTLSVDAGSGRPVKSTLEGVAAVRIVFKQFKVPFRATVTSSN